MSASEGFETVECVAREVIVSIVALWKWMHGRAVSVIVSGVYFAPVFKVILTVSLL